MRAWSSIGTPSEVHLREGGRGYRWCSDVHAGALRTVHLRVSGIVRKSCTCARMREVVIGF